MQIKQTNGHRDAILRAPGADRVAILANSSKSRPEAAHPPSWCDLPADLGSGGMMTRFRHGR